MKNINRNKALKKVAALVMVCIVASSGIIYGVIKFFKGSKIKDNKPTNSVTSIDTDNNVSISDLGVDVIVSEKEEINDVYINPSNEIDVNKLVEGNDGTIYINNEALNNSENIGTKINTPDETLSVETNGTVVKKEPYYEIKDENEIIIEQGKGTPAFTETFTPVENGEVVSSEVVSENTTVTIKPINPTITTTTTTTKPTTTTTTTKPTTTTTTTPVTNNYYSIVVQDETGKDILLTFETQEDCEQWFINGFEGYGLDSDGIMKSITKIEEYQKVK